MLWLLFFTFVPPSLSEDIDLFAGLPDGVDVETPNVLFVIDNTSNWARQSQQWPSRDAQGQSEVEAIKRALLPYVDEKINVGLLLFTTQGNANENGAYVRFPMQLLTSGDTGTYAQLSEILTTIFENINDPAEKRNSNEPYGNLFNDLYNYLAGEPQVFLGRGTPDDLADETGYVDPFGVFQSPLTQENICSDVNIVFLTNPSASGPANDGTENSNALRALYAEFGDVPAALAGSGSGQPLPLPDFDTDVEEGGFFEAGVSQEFWKKNELDQCTAYERENIATSDCGNIPEEGVQGSCACYEITETCERGNRCKWTVGAVSPPSIIVTPGDGEDTESGRDWNLDDWASFLFNYGVPVSLVLEDGSTLTQRISVTTHTIDVFNAQQNADHTALMLSTAEAGDGEYFTANNEEDLVAALGRILTDIVSASSSYAAVTLPVNAGNRSQSKNQVYVGSFRPAQDMEPRWFGNLKRYQLVINEDTDAVELADVRGVPAVNDDNGAITECAESWWTHDSSVYDLEGMGISPSPRSQCPDAANAWSDIPDGPLVEKGGVAQQIREGNQGSRTLYTVEADGLGLTQLNTRFSSEAHYSYVIGSAPGAGENWVVEDGGLRPSVHGDVVHSRPVILNYGPQSEGADDLVVAYYGANDGLFRAVIADDGDDTNVDDGIEAWALIAPDHFAELGRLKDNAPLILYEALADSVEDTYPEGASPIRKDYFFDGRAGQYVVYADDGTVDRAILFPTMRRGGRQVYALEVADDGMPRLDASSAPEHLWTFSDDQLGQTWSMPLAFEVAGHDGPVVAFGGGFDPCLDTDAAAFPTTCEMGNAIYVLDAETGTLLYKFTSDELDAPVVADLAPIDTGFDGVVDYLYAVDAKGGVYRVAFGTPAEGFDLDPAVDWSMVKIAHMANNGAEGWDYRRRFMNAPVVFPIPKTGYVGIAVGSGDRERPLKTNYPYAESVENRFYYYRDDPAEIPDEPYDLDTLLNANTYADGPIGTASRGWFYSLNGSEGEQVVNPGAVGRGRVFFNSYRPGGQSTGLCSPPIGVATAYSIPIFDPAETPAPQTIDLPGMPIPPVITTVLIGDEPRTVCIGCKGFDVIELEPVVDPTRSRQWWIEEFDD
jgi:outer membrane protein assembly factor BamB